MVDAIYRVRTLVEKNGASTTSSRTQAAGIAQGCPLSPYLRIIVIPILLEIVGQQMAERSLEKSSKPCLHTKDVLYADDTYIADRRESGLLSRAIGYSGTCWKSIWSVPQCRENDPPPNSFRR
mmetsp:Transcript_75430/g.202483  ORF Transcript_75430/g.202483 Transcript_75430/m.202483 type:complete len:123 (-) Transcript_75430:165-533(-)